MDKNIDPIACRLEHGERVVAGPADLKLTSAHAESLDMTASHTSPDNERAPEPEAATGGSAVRIDLQE